MDIKIGSVTWDKFASEEKISSELNKKAFDGQTFRILGFRVSDVKSLRLSNVSKF